MTKREGVFVCEEAVLQRFCTPLSLSLSLRAVLAKIYSAVEECVCVCDVTTTAKFFCTLSRGARAESK